MNGVTILFVYAVIMILATVILTKQDLDRPWQCR